MLDPLYALSPLDGRYANAVAALRPIARQDWQLPPARCYAVPYWRQGEAEEAYHQQRHAFVDSDGEEAV